MKTILLLFVLTVLAPSFAVAKEKPGITVKFRITEKVYTSKYGNLIPGIEKHLSKKIAKFLNGQIAVFKFSSIEKYDDTLNIELCRRLPARSDISFDVLLKLTIAGKNVPDNCDPAKWEFAPDGSHSNYRGDSALFVKKIYDRVVSDDLFDKEELVCKLLTNRWITENAEAIKIDFEKKFWTLGYTYDQLEVGDESQLRIIQEHRQVPNKIIRRKFLASVRKLVNKPQDEQIYAEFLTADKLTKVKVGCCSWTLDDQALFKKETLEKVCAFQVIKLTRFDRNSTVLTTSTSGIRK